MPYSAQRQWLAPRAYLRLRLRLLGRLLREIGWWRLALLGGLLGLGLLQTLEVLRTHPAGRWLVPLLAAWSVAAAHRRRQDGQFLTGLAPDCRPWLATEYALLTLPVALGLLLALRAPGAAALTLALAALAAWLRRPAPRRPPGTAGAARFGARPLSGSVA
jgi:hypothetical protein